MYEKPSPDTVTACSSRSKVTRSHRAVNPCSGMNDVEVPSRPSTSPVPTLGAANEAVSASVTIVPSPAKNERNKATSSSQSDRATESMGSIVRCTRGGEPAMMAGWKTAS